MAIDEMRLDLSKGNAGKRLLTPFRGVFAPLLISLSLTLPISGEQCTVKVGEEAVCLNDQLDPLVQYIVDIKVLPFPLLQLAERINIMNITDRRLLFCCRCIALNGYPK
jgi:hypothetical protein